MPKAIGIDLGTTFSCAAYMNGDSTVEVVKNHYGNKITPSVVHFGRMFREVGEEAQAKRGSDPQNTVFQIKRFMGRSADDVEIRKRPYPFEILSTRRGDAAIRVTPRVEKGEEAVESKTYCPEQISSYILKYMMVLAREEIGGDVKDAVITVPANFNNAQRQATKDAGEMAGLNVLRIINEPTAAALAYGYGLNSQKKRVVLVYDLGGGTFDVSIVRCQGLESDVLSTAGVTDLGGEDFDRLLFEYASAEYNERGITILPEEEFGLYKSCEEAKKTLSVSERATIELFKNGKSYACEITRSTFEELCINLFEKTIECVEDAINEARVDKESIDDIVLVGGSSRIPKVQQMVRGFFGHKELKFNIPPDHAVAVGAAILAESLSSNEESLRSTIRGAVKLADVLPFSLGTNVSYDTFSVILRRNTQYPTSNMECYSNGDDDQDEMHFLIIEGESARYSENRILGICKIPVREMPVGENTVMTTYSVDENGILSVHVKDVDTGEERSAKVQTSRQTDEERLAMVRNARLEEEYETIQRAKYEARTTFGEAVHSMKRTVHKTYSDEKKAELKKLIEREESWIEGKNPSNEDLITRASAIKEKLTQIMKP
ncbi:hypothetical protein PMAYCL1PPCAC_03186 [Pristionchus mayeri]|uniref:Uncharacterized protein n=1 Tax=Pristionchus mayeri TaxID=1317129 RepID=A0AAN5C9A3_9BILA|nr:hypothetical protein PMAYCL1PPCAC_03186 [Pristionchus mayeri]